MRIFILTLTLTLTSCATKSIREQKMSCAEKFIDKDVDALKSRDVCTWVFEKN